ncbi:MAG TPA: VOC family protein [Acidimicrobiales bacterium]|nr:VOC family protein [Acidimicrobiales bacterium]
MTVRWTTAFLDFPAATFEAGCAFWRGVTGYGLSAPRGSSGEFATLEPPHGDAFIRVQRVQTDIAGCHVDLHVDDVEATARRASALGALTRKAEPNFVVMASPAGFPFCLVAAYPGRGFERPPPRGWPNGQCSLVDQICVDIAPVAFAEEARFWEALTRWERRPGSRPEFEYLVRPPEMPLRFLLQRLAGNDGRGICRAHLDLACDDMRAEQRRHEGLGAVVMAEPSWTTLSDPTGLLYCITRRHPATGVLGPPSPVA